MLEDIGQRGSTRAPFLVKVEASPRINLAFQQNGVPAVRRLGVECLNGGPYEELTLTLRSDPPELADEHTWTIATLRAGEKVRFPERDIKLRPGLLSRLTEPLRGEFLFELSCRDQLLASVSKPVELLAQNEWVGFQEGAELLAAFVTPNDPSIDPILSSASKILKRNSALGGAIDGYLSGSREHVWEMASAVWSVMCGRQLTYALPPASFERRGQKVRLPGQVMQSGVATCIDTSVLFAAALEQAGLHPFITVIDGHAFPGVWLEPHMFEAVVTEDPVALRARINNDNVLVFESTFATAAKHASFREAIRAATQCVAADQEAKFLGVIDIARARMVDILPLGTKVEDAGGPAAKAKPSVFERAPKLPDFRIGRGGRAIDRVEVWKSKLQDLSLRNPLVNLRPSAKTVFPLAGVALDPLQTALASGRALTVRPIPDFSLDGKRSAGGKDAYAEADLVQRHADDALGNGEVIVDQGEKKLQNGLVELLRLARSDLREGGATTVFLASGFLRWRRGGGDRETYSAPLVLTPLMLRRESARSPIQIRQGQDEVRFNPTLVQLLRRDFEIDLARLDETLPLRDNNAVDINALLYAVGQEINAVPGWEIAHEAAIARFSFAKHLMWRDLADRQKQLRRSPVVRCLLEPKPGAFAREGAFPDPARLDADVSPADTFTPLSADSSQMVAVRAAAQGKSFVLMGPPGTGKSQTIANMIAQCLADGKRVLFVAEKTAALDVVSRRLEEVGLRDLCLELHSNRVSRTDLMAQLERAWKGATTGAPPLWSELGNDLKTTRARLNAEVARLHTAGPGDVTPYAAIGASVRGREMLALRPHWRSWERGATAELKQLRGIAQRCDLLAAELGGVDASAFQGVGCTEWTPQMSEELFAAADAVSSAASLVGEHWPRAAEAFALRASCRRQDVVTSAGTIAARLGKIGRRLVKRASREDVRAAADRLHIAVGLLRRRDELLAAGSVPYAPKRAQRLDLDALAAQWRDAGEQFWLTGWLHRAQVRAAGPRAPPRAKPDDVSSDLQLLAEARALEAQLSAFDDLTGLTGGIWRGARTNADRIALFAAIIDMAGVLERGDDGGEISVDRVTPFYERLQTRDAPDGLGAFVEAYAGLRTALARLASAARAPAHMLVDAESPDWLGALAGLAERWRKARGELQSWCAWRRARAEAIEAGLAPVVDALERGSLAAGAAQGAVEVNHARWWLAEAFERDTELSSFSRPEREDLTRRFADLDARVNRETVAAIRARLASRVPAFGEEASGEGWGLIWRELAKNRSRLSVRELMSEAGGEIAALTPCFLMSPISVAQYLTPDQSSFDLVIFDEASQIPVWDAVGALGRANQAVIVGDPNQLPPTAFFQRGDTDEDAEDAPPEDAESILDECIAAGMPIWRLQWHYRSRSESLISFSNHTYYDGDLVTFPAPVAEDRALSLTQVDGVYDRGGKRVNRAEAEAIVAEITARLSSQDPAVRGASIGVITMNAEQQRLIEDLLDEARRTEDAFEPYFDTEIDEPIVVRNLESIQGEERDVILLSVGYGPDAEGRMSMNFGPLNKLGGERRLNVAVTRARQELKVFASFAPEAIELSRTRARGVRDLRAFLSFAKDGASLASPHSAAAAEDMLAGAIVEALAARGWKARAGVGGGRFRVALGVEDPEEPGSYLAAVETDGPAYGAAASARDRDILRPCVLEGLGWRLHRAWAADWLADPEGAADRLAEALGEQMMRRGVRAEQE